MQPSFLQRGKMKVLIADDSELMRKRLITLISGLEGIDVIEEAEDCGETIKIIRELNPDVVILDIRMPGGSGSPSIRLPCRSGVAGPGARRHRAHICGQEGGLSHPQAARDHRASHKESERGAQGRAPEGWGPIRIRSWFRGGSCTAVGRH